MQFKSAALLAGLLAVQAAAIALPTPDDDGDAVVGSIAGSDGVTTDGVDAYEQVEEFLPDVVTVPDGTGNELFPEDFGELSDAAVAGATSSGDLTKRGTCVEKLSKFNGPNVASLSRDQWDALSLWSNTALQAPTPDGFFQIPGMQALTRSIEASHYMGFTSDFTSYDTKQCAARCNKLRGCAAFVMGFERSPTRDLDRNNCPDGIPQTVVKCLFYGVAPQASDATNKGQLRGRTFYTSHAGYNGYSRIPVTPAGFSGPVNFGDRTIEAPRGSDTLMAVHTYPGSSYNPQLCADACLAKTAYNKKEADKKTAKTGIVTPYRTCRMFDAFLAYKSNTAPMFSCTYYTQAYGIEYATNYEQFNDHGVRFSKGSSNGFYLK